MTYAVSFIRKFLLKEKDIKKATFFWNAFSAVTNSFQTMVLLLVITRLDNMNDASIFVMAYAVGNLMMNIGKYGVRQFQVTDVNERFGFRAYKRARDISVSVMFWATAGFLAYQMVFGNYTWDKAIVIFLICVLKGIEAYEDVFHGRMQQKGRLDVAGRILGIRLFIFVVGFAVMYILTHNLLLTSCVNVLVSGGISYFLNSLVFGEFCDKPAGKNKMNSEDKRALCSDKRKILLECLPLCLSMVFNMYMGNAPKYVIDTAVSDEVQTCFNIVFMPVFVVSLLSTFIFQPCLKRMGELWEKKDTGKLVRLILKLMMITVVLDAVITVVGAYIGIPALELVYGVELGEYWLELIIFMIAGGMIALLNLFVMVLTTSRRQNYLLYGYIVSSLIMFVLGGKVLNGYGLFGLSVFFLLTMAGINLYCALVSVLTIRKQRIQE